MIPVTIRMIPMLNPLGMAKASTETPFEQFAGTCIMHTIDDN